MLLYLDDKKWIDTSKGLDISIPLEGNLNNPRAWYVDAPVIEPVRVNGYVGAVVEGGSVNFRNIFFNPHGHGTHTECLGHITTEVHSVNQHLKQSFFKAIVISVAPKQQWNEVANVLDDIITAAQLSEILKDVKSEALVIRTLPNDIDKKQKNYSASNPPYIEEGAIEILNKIGIEHLLIDLPSVDREEDGGKLAFHHAFWSVPQAPQFHKTITEFIYVPDTIEDGNYLLNLQTAPFENDATPSRPVLFRIFDK